jgi:hypothetical protein
MKWRASAALPSPSALSNSSLLPMSCGAENPTWWLYGAGQKFVINAVTREVTPPVQQTSPSDPLAQGLDVDLQRAAAIFLPASLSQANEKKEPKASL